MLLRFAPDIDPAKGSSKGPEVARKSFTANDLIERTRTADRTDAPRGPIPRLEVVATPLTAKTVSVAPNQNQHWLAAVQSGTLTRRGVVLLAVPPGIE